MYGKTAGFMSSEATKDTYYSLRLDLDSARLSQGNNRSLGGVFFTIEPEEHVKANIYATISACPGDPGTNVRFTNGNATLSGDTVGTRGRCVFNYTGITAMWDPSWFGISPGEKPTDFCAVEPGKTYYITMFNVHPITEEYKCDGGTSPSGEYFPCKPFLWHMPAIDYSATTGTELMDLSRMSMNAEERVNAFRVIATARPLYGFGTPVMSLSRTLRDRFITEKQSEPYNLVTNPFGRR